MLSYLLDTSGENVMPIPTPEKPKLKPIDVEIVLPGDTPERLQTRVMEQAEWVLLPQALALLCKENREGSTE